MTSWIRTASLIILASFATPALAAPAIGEQAPSFRATDTNGNEVSTESLKGKNVVLEWTNHGCPFVKKHYKSGNMQQLQRIAKSKDVVWISIISSAPSKQGHVDADEANALTKEREAMPAHVILDESGKIGRDYAAKTTPHMFVIDKKGTLVYMGAIDSKATADPADIAGATNYITNAIVALEEGTKVDPSNTKPYGCSIKY